MPDLTPAPPFSPELWPQLNLHRFVHRTPTAEEKRKLHQAMTALAERCIDRGHTQTAADILAFLLSQDDLDARALDRADDCFAELESRVCPRIILDARDFAATMDLRTMIEYLLDIFQPPRI